MLRNTELPFDQWPPAYFQTLVAPDAPPSVRDEVRSIVSELRPAATRTAIRAFAEADLRDVLPNIRVPTLLVYGERDVRAPEEVWAPLSSGVPDARLVVVPRVGHMIDIEAPERLIDEIPTFVRELAR